MFISFEGIDGSGKSTQARRLAEDLRAQGLDVILTREPGGSPGVEDIRTLLVTGDGDRWSAETEILLFMAARRDHIERVILPALERGCIVICDRFTDSTRAYQGVRSDRHRLLVDQLHDAVIAIEPDLTLLIDVDPEVAARRDALAKGLETRFESMGRDFQASLRDEFAAIAVQDPGRIAWLNGNREADTVAEDVRGAVSTALKDHEAAHAV